MADGLGGCPTTKLLLGASALFTLIAADAKAGREMYLDAGSQVYSSHQLWRLGTSLLPFEGMAEAIVGWMLLHRLGKSLERMLGPSKYATFVLLASLAAIGARLSLISALPAAVHASVAPTGSGAGSAATIVPGGGAPHSWIRTGLASGPYHVIFGLLPLYYKYVPCRTRDFWGIGPVHVSDKGAAYALFAALACCMGPRSLLAAAYSLAFGLLYALPGPGKGLQALSLPHSVRAGIGALVLPFLGEGGPVHTLSGGASSTSNGRGGSTGGGGGGRSPMWVGGGTAVTRTLGGQSGFDFGAVGGGAAGGAGAAGAGAGAGAGGDAPLVGPEPDAAAVERVMAMGFGREETIAALRHAFGNEEAAVHRLLGS